MDVGLGISILSLLATVVIGLVQIRLSKNQKAIALRIEKIETKVSQDGVGNSITGIVGNSSDGDISYNKL